MCEQQYFGEYVLGWRGPSGQKADKGTICHKVLEILAVINEDTTTTQPSTPTAPQKPTQVQGTIKVELFKRLSSVY